MVKYQRAGHTGPTTFTAATLNELAISTPRFQLARIYINGAHCKVRQFIKGERKSNEIFWALAAPGGHPSRGEISQ